MLPSPFRYAVVNDAAQINDILQRSLNEKEVYNEAARACYLGIYTTTAFIQLITHDPQCVIVSEHEGSITSFAIVQNDNGVAYIPWIAVDPEYRSLRLAHRLCDACIISAWARGFKKMWWVSRTSNRGLNRYWLRTGKRLIGEVKNHWFEQDYYFWEIANPASSSLPNGEK
jgi:ribosomal protein S18 acetylase RimI-like enzyme